MTTTGDGFKPRYRLKTTAEFDRAYKRMSQNVKEIVGQTVRRLANDAYGDTKSVGDGVFEARVHHLGGVRVYYTVRRDASIIILLLTGNKDSQRRDIPKAKAILAQLIE